MKFSSAVMALAATAVASPLEPRDKAKTPPVSVKGNAFWKEDGTRFYIRGVDYQPGGEADPKDPIADPELCKRDIKKFKDLGANTIRIYTVDNTANHDECMKALSDAGIYLALDVNSGKYSINRKTPKPSYNDVYLQSVFATIDQFSKYDNTLLFFSGNEVINSPDTTQCAPYIKAVTRDMKNYIKARKYRPIPVGYSAADVEENRYETAAYMNCGAEEARSDFYAFNDYSYCAPSSFEQSGWSSKVEQYKNYSIPLFLSEFGCQKNPPRPFDEISDLYSTKMSSVYSGGMVYEYTEESDKKNYGLVRIDGNKVEELTDYKNLKEKYGKAKDPQGDGGAQMNLKPLSCPKKSKNWNVDGEALPSIPVPAQKFMKEGAGPGPGLKGKGSQWAGTQSSGMDNGSSSGDGTTTSSGAQPSGSSSAAVSVRPVAGFAPVACAMIVVLSTFLGASLL